jgi:RND family efflux transporter MFP subunit
MRRFQRSLALVLLLTAAVAYLLAHEGHAPLPGRGARVDVEKGQIILSREAREALDVRTEEVTRRPLPETLLAYATLAAPWQGHAFASSRLPGKVVALHVRPGQGVQAGQLLAEVRSLELEALQLELRNAENDVRVAEKALAGMENVGASVPEQTLLDARVALQQHRNALDVARGKWVSLGLDPAAKGPARLPVRSPVAGTVIHADLSVGKVVEPGEHLFEVVDLRTVWARVGVLEKDLRRVRAGLEVELRLTAYPGRTFPGKIQVRGLALEAGTHLATAWAELSNAEGKEPVFLPVMSGQARVILPSGEKTWTLPASAVLDNGVEQFVLVEEARTAETSEYRKKAVAILRQSLDLVEVAAGDLYPGDRVVTRGAAELGVELWRGLQTTPHQGFGVLKIGPQAARTIRLELAKVGRHRVEEVVEVEGHVDIPPDRRSTASAQLGGNVLRLHVDRAQAVQAGQLLAEVASLEFHNLQLDLLKEHLSFELLDRQHRRLLHAAAAVPTRRLLDLESALTASRNRRDSLRSRLEVVGLTKEQISDLLSRKQLVEAIPVRSAISGHVVEFTKVLGQVVKADEPLVTVHDLSGPMVVGYVSERDLGRVRIGQPARVRLVSDPERVLTGEVVRSARVFAGDQTLSVWVRLDRPPDEPLRHNQLARVSLTVERREAALAVPRSALVREGEQAFVFVRREAWAFERRPVRPGYADDRLVEILGGLQEGEAVAARGTAGLRTAFASVR